VAKPSTSLLKRRLDIAEIVRKQGEIKVDDLADMLGVSGVTIRNDLNYLEQQGYLKRSFGGAIYTAQQGGAPVREREPVASDKALETEMARQLAALTAGNEILFLDVGPILRKSIPFLAEHEALSLVFNDLHHVTFTSEFLCGEHVLLGGKLSSSGDSTEGDIAIASLRQHQPDRALIVVDYVGENGIISVTSEARAQLLSALLAVCPQVIAVIPHRPVYGETRFAVGNLQQLAGVVTPQVVAAEYHTRLQAAGMTNSYTNNECLTWLNPALQNVK